MVAVTLFVVSTSTILFFFGANGDTTHQDLKTDLIEGSAITHSNSKELTYRKLVNNEQDSVFVMNVAGMISFASGDVESNLGYKPTALNNQIFFLMIHPDDLSTFLGAFGKVIQNKKAVFNVGPYRFRDQGGEYHLHMASLTPVITGGNIEAIAVSSKDISKNVPNSGKTIQPKGKKIMNETDDAQARFLADKPA